MTDRIFVTLSSFAEHDSSPVEMIESSGVAYAINPSGKRITPGELLSEGASATVLIAGVEPYDAGMFDGLGKLRCISRCGAGVDAIDLAEARRRGITVLNTPDAPTQAVAELAVAMMLGISRRFVAHRDHFRRHEWTRLETHMLRGRTVGVVGLGRIGREVVRLVTAFGAHVLGSDPVADDSWAAGAGVELTDLDDLVRRSDIVTLHAARGSGNPVILGPDEIRSMREGAVVINLARGGMVDERALADALRSGRLAGAGLDVFGEEPYSGELCDLDNVILTPHSATLAVECRVAMEREAVQNALAFIAGPVRGSSVVA